MFKRSFPTDWVMNAVSPPGEYLSLHVMKEAEVILDLVPDLALSTLYHQRALLKGERVHGPEGPRLATKAGEANLRPRKQI